MKLLLSLLKNAGVGCWMALLLISWKTADRGEFSWNKTTHDFDRLLRGQTYTYRFMFSNTGDENITVSGVSANTSGIAVKWTTTPVRPLQSGFVEVTLSPVKAGPMLISLEVKSDAATPVTTLWVKGEVMTATEMKTASPAPQGTH